LFFAAHIENRPRQAIRLLLSYSLRIPLTRRPLSGANKIEEI
jgi:hypothetical protein